MKQLTKLLTLQLRPYVAEMLDAYVATVKARFPQTEQGQRFAAKVTASLIIRNLLKRPPAHRPETLAWLKQGRQATPAKQMRVRISEDEHAALLKLQGSYAQHIAALIVEAVHPDGNYPANPEHKPTATTKEP